MNTGVLLGIALGAIVVLLFLVIKIKLSAFVSILLVAAGTALAAGIPVSEIVPVMQKGMGNTLASVMIIVGLGSMLGRVIEAGGGADALATRFTARWARNASSRLLRQRLSCWASRCSSTWDSSSWRRLCLVFLAWQKSTR